MTKKIIQKILIANRSEIALRIIKTAHAMNIQSVAIYSHSDKNSLHVSAADEAYSLNADKAADSYLNIEKIIHIAKQSGCDAIHPGYGFLAENAAFAQACADNHIIFIGPKAETISLMGDKASAKTFCKEQDIPVIPGEENLTQDLATFKKYAEKIGVPLLLKASAGGGGKGMKLVKDLNEVESAYHSAKREALASFGDDNLLIEKYFDKARHIEIQVLADQHGNVVHLFDRDCSLQRRHQKIIEEAPAFGLSEACRKAMQASAIKLCQAIHYHGVGTLEFLVNEQENFYLMEMNTRLQVEHAVSEQITGIDLVEQQILVAQGETLKLKQNEIKISGHSIEARIYAEQCKNNFLPASGIIEHLQFPNEGIALRIDHALHNHQNISSLYDPMIGKIVCWGADRNSAINALNTALSNTHIIGLETNRNFLIS
jgi:3-methylcrotonyl-CoA carboxylase alpha subunit